MAYLEKDHRMHPQTVMPSDLTEGEKNAVRHNWAFFGLKKWWNDNGTEYWFDPKDPDGGKLEFHEWS